MNPAVIPLARWAATLNASGYDLRYWALRPASSVPPSLQHTVAALARDGCAGLLLVINTGATVQQRWMQQWNGSPKEHPLDSFCRQEIQEALGNHAHRFLFPLEKEQPDLLACLSLFGLPVGSPIMQGIHPQFGSWWAVRALVAIQLPDDAATPSRASVSSPDSGTDSDMDAAGDSESILAQTHPQAPTPDNLCATCPAPCVRACPGQAVHKSGWQAQACVTQRQQPDSPCASDCPARVACPVGIAYRYPPEVRAYHYGISLRIIRGWRQP